ncbi:ABC transporter permease [Deinococcus sp.]|uniref:ABC transporter permease n=1 Tax=Deinococcus sp. TaxID=47478 RepID=UPI003B5CC765
MQRKLSGPSATGAARPRRIRSKPVQRFLRNRLALLGAVVFIVIVVTAILAPLLTPYNPVQAAFGEIRKAPSAAHWFGTDELGRDVLSRVLYSARVSLTASIASVALALVLGGGLGLISGYFRGRVDEVIMRLTDALLSLPFLVLAIALAAILGPSLQNAMLAIGIVSAPAFARIIRGEILAQREREYVAAAIAIGASDARVLFKYLVPNISGALIVQISLSIANAILAESSLSFLGLGIQPPTASWGAMLNAARPYLTDAPWMTAFPGLAIFLACLAFNLIGDGLREALDPQARRQ